MTSGSTDLQRQGSRNDVRACHVWVPVWKYECKNIGGGHPNIHELSLEYIWAMVVSCCQGN